MKTATVRTLRNQYSALLDWIEAGEEISISRHGRVIARLVPEGARAAGRVDWSKSAALRMDKRKLPLLDAATVANLLKDNQGSC
jgi:antitoxin (DNA-binding transcriptional repressor) of toxin-antitoxin stability system